MKNASLARAAIVAASFGLSVLAFSSSAKAASIVKESTPGFPVNPAAYNVFLDANDPLPVTVEVTVPKTPNKLDLFLLQDLSGSFSDDLPVLRSLVPNLVSSVTGVVADAQFGAGSFVDKPISPFGDEGFGDYVYRTNLALTPDAAALQSAVNGLSIFYGVDEPEAQLEGLLQTAVRGNTEIGFRDDAFKVVVLSTDATFHKAGDFASRPANNGDAILDGTPPGTGEDYPSVLQVRDALKAANIIPIFAVTRDVVSTYQNLVSDFGFGSVVELSSDSSNLVSAISTGLGNVFRDITLTPVSDDFGYVNKITPPVFTDVAGGETRTFLVELLADGVGDEDDTLSLFAPGFGTTLVNVDVKDDSTSIPEPSSILGLLAVGALCAGSHSKRQQRQKAAER